MGLSLADIKAVVQVREWFTVTRATVRVAGELGGYLLDVEGQPVDVIEGMQEDAELGEIVSISGIAHPPDRSWRIAFRIDDSGPKVAANAPREALDQIGPRLQAVVERT